MPTKKERNSPHIVEKEHGEKEALAVQIPEDGRGEKEALAVQYAMPDRLVDRTPPMDKGWWGWLVCFASFSVNATIFGIINTNGVVFVYLKKKYEDKDNVSVLTAFVGSISVGMTFLLSPLAGILTDRFGVRKVAFTGAVLATLGMLLSSFVETLELYYLTLGVLFGVGSSLVYAPSLVILGHYFKKYIGLVNGIVTFGSSLYTIILPLVLKKLLETVGLQHTLQILSVKLFLLVLYSLVFKPRLPPAILHDVDAQHAHRSWKDKWQQLCGQLVNFELWKNKRYRLWALTIPSALFGYFVPYVHLVQYVNDILQDDKGNSGEILVMCIGITSGIGRIFFGFLADLPNINRMFLQQLSFLCIGLLTIALPFAGQFEYLVVICLGLGIFDGCFISLLGPIAIDLTGRAGATQAIGNLLGLCSIPLTLGPPIAGWIKDHTGSYKLAFLLAGVPPLVGAAVMTLIYRVKPSVPLDVTESGQGEGKMDDESMYLTSDNSHPVNPQPKTNIDKPKTTSGGASQPLLDDNQSKVIVEPTKLVPTEYTSSL